MYKPTILKQIINRLRRRRPGLLEASSRFATGSFSQCGEDVIVRYLFRLRGIHSPTYLDLGAHAPFYLSNTALFYINGSRGVNVEPNPELIDQLKRERPLDKNINLGVSRAGGSSEFFCMEDPALSTFSKHECDRLVAFGKKLKQVATVRTLPLVRIVNEYCEGVFPDFLSIDIEGMELEILSSIRDMATYPKVICVETAEYSPIGSGEKRKELMRLIESLGFQLYADTNLNSIYVRKEFWTQVAAKPA